jgi:hypothetical protein
MHGGGDGEGGGEDFNSFFFSANFMEKPTALGS